MNKSLLRGVLLLTLGIVIIVATVIIEQSIRGSFRAGMFTGSGVGIIGIAVAYIIRTIQYNKSPAKLKKDEMMSTEERQVMIKDKASSMAFAVSNFTFVAILMIFAAINTKMEIILIVCGGMFINIIIFGLIYYYYSKKY